MLTAQRERAIPQRSREGERFASHEQLNATLELRHFVLPSRNRLVRLQVDQCFARLAIVERSVVAQNAAIVVDGIDAVGNGVSRRLPAGQRRECLLEIFDSFVVGKIGEKDEIELRADYGHAGAPDEQAGGFPPFVASDYETANDRPLELESVCLGRRREGIRFHNRIWRLIMQMPNEKRTSDGVALGERVACAVLAAFCCMLLRFVAN